MHRLVFGDGAALRIALRVTLGLWLVLGVLYPLPIWLLAQWHGYWLARWSSPPPALEAYTPQQTYVRFLMPEQSKMGERSNDQVWPRMGLSEGETAATTRAQLLRRAGYWQLRNPGFLGDGLPMELLVPSASGLDPHLSEAAVLWQLPRVAAARNVAVERLKPLLEQARQGRLINVHKLNFLLSLQDLKD